ncbi:MAG TPA: hypothetical protein VHZ50_18415 [Puia sp.]|nr:hypothetical protein [Puia sp.]
MKKKIIHIILLSCRTATRLIEKKLHTKLSRKESVQLKWHKSVCEACTLYEKQIVFLDKILKSPPSEIHPRQEFPIEETRKLQEKIIDLVEE